MSASVQSRPRGPTVISLFALLLLLLTTAASAPRSLPGAERTPPHPTARPNIVLIVTDDQGYGDCSANGVTDLPTPAMEAIARRGLRFTQFRVNPLCAPTRASILTGLYSIEAGMWRGPGRERGEADDRGDARPRRLPDDVRLLPQFLREAGYATGMFGKWHLGEEPQNRPNARGFDQFVGFLAGSHPYQPRRNSKLLENEQPLTTSTHTTDLFADRAIAFIREHRQHPFFCYVPFNAVHGPLRSADRDADSGRPDWLEKFAAAGVPQPRRDYCAVMAHADARIGDILTALRELGLEQRTLVIVLSDNGGITHTYPSNNGPLRGGKGETYEGGVRVPCVMQWPGVIPPGSVSHADAVHFDLFCTILDAAGVPVPKMNGPYPVRGVSLMTHLRSGGTAPLPDRYLFWDLYGQCAALHGRWKLVGRIANHHGRFDAAVREAARTKFALYDLANDVGETTDLADREPEVYRDLKERHLEWLRQFAQ